MSEITMQPVTGAAIQPYCHALAELRIAVFREWPYLYKGTLAYERNYLKHYAECPESVVVLARSNEQIVGASTGLPLSAADPHFQQAFDGTDFALESIFYFGESVLLPPYRGRGVGRSFFELREAQARDIGARYAAFCAVERTEDDPRKPAGYRTLDSFWGKLGYRKYPKIQTQFSWQAIDAPESRCHTLCFWLKPL